MARRFRIVVALAAVVAALAAAAGVQAGTDRQLFRGEVERVPGSSLKMRTQTTFSHLNVSLFLVRDFEADCGPYDLHFDRFALVGVGDPIKIGERGRFHVRKDSGDQPYNLRGKIEGRRAKGVFRISTKYEEPGGQTRNCDSGRLDWSAHASAS